MRGAPSYIRNPGPGTYDSRGMKPRKVDAAFRSTSPRFAREKARSPGPGAYDAETAVSLEAQVESRLVSRTGAFGTTDGRFPPRGAVPAGSETPGPAAYHADVPQLMRRYRDRDVQSSSFSTQVDRFRTRDEPGEPAYVLCAWLEPVALRDCLIHGGGVDT